MNLCRIVLNFYPETGRSIVHVVELSKSLKPYLTKQFVITRKYYGEHYDDKSYEKSSGVHVYRACMRICKQTHIGDIKCWII
jgi:hypothetical protein